MDLAITDDLKELESCNKLESFDELESSNDLGTFDEHVYFYSQIHPTMELWKACLTKKKKKLFYRKYGPRMVDKLGKRLTKLRTGPADTLPQDECWLCPNPTRFGQHRMVMKIDFIDEDGRNEKHTININAGCVAMLVHGSLTEKFKRGIIEHKWHASHLCGNWTCR